jgi:hypothetical protein
VIQLDKEGKMNYVKLIDAQEARLPLMVSNPLKDKKTNEVLFYAKRGTKKQLVNIEIQ